ncbi:MAG: amidase, partial [Pseudomonadota bacterium]
MRLDEYTKLDATGLAQCIRKGEISATEAAELGLRAIERVNPDLNAVVEVFQDRVEKPTASDGLLAGVPILNKDLSFSDAGRLQEMGSRLAEGYRPSFDSTSVKRLKSAGLNIIGRTTTPEFGNSGLTENLLTGVTRNPWDTARTPGGSSG